MKEDQEQSGGSLVPSASSALTRKSSGLIRRGLEDLLKGQSLISSSVQIGLDKTVPKIIRWADLVNSLGMEFTLIPAGKFMMGSDLEEHDEEPIHEVTISRPFYMGIYPVTQSEWQEIMGNNPSELIGDDYPVHGVSWNDAQEFIRKLNLPDEQPTILYDNWTGETRPKAQFEYRLPSEAEWEYACRAGTTGDYAGPLDSMAWYANNSGHRYVDAAQTWETEQLADNGNQPHVVGTKEANAFRLFDMHGNVWEWCQDFYDENYYRNSPSIDPQGPSSGQYRVLRGGSWDSVATLLRSALRLYGPPGNRGVDGFRLVAVVRTQ